MAVDYVESVDKSSVKTRNCFSCVRPFAGSETTEFYAKSFHELTDKHQFLIINFYFEGFRMDGDIRMRLFSTRTFAVWP
jgi:hypothetical protein